nr:hypothetical protein [Nostoc sp. CreGUA01]
MGHGAWGIGHGAWGIEHLSPLLPLLVWLLTMKHDQLTTNN